MSNLARLAEARIPPEREHKTPVYTTGETPVPPAAARENETETTKPADYTRSVLPGEQLDRALARLTRTIEALGVFAQSRVPAMPPLLKRKLAQEQARRRQKAGAKSVAKAKA